MIEPGIERYGRYARESALADFIEVQAINGESMSQETLTDYIVDMGWTGKGDSLVAGPEPIIDLDYIWGPKEDTLDDEDEDGQEIARSVFTLLRQRQAIGSPRYPFRVENSGVTRITDINNAYGFLLAASVAHAWRIATQSDPKILLESFVCRALDGLGFLTANLGDWRRSGNFDDRLMAAGEGLYMTPTPDQAFRARFAQDEGVDVVGHLWLGDHRPGRWVVIGQVTCAISDMWASKFREPRVSQWQKLLGMMIRPQRLLAIPYHVSMNQFYLLVEKGDGILLDRLRLAQIDVMLNDQERSIVETVMAEETLSV